MNFATWMIPSLQPVTSKFDSAEEVARGMQHLGTTAFPRDDAPRLWAGQTTWAWQAGGLWHAVGWDWIEQQRDVMVLSDPMALVTNVDFASHADGEAGRRQRILLLNSIVHMLPWQNQVLSGLRSVRNQSASSVGPKSAASATRGLAEMELGAYVSMHP